MTRGHIETSLFRFSPFWMMITAALFAVGSTGSFAADDDIWPALSKDIFGERAVVEDHTAVTLEAPYRADDAALVPLTVRIPQGVSEKVTKLTLVIDQNPAPVVGDFVFGPAAGTGERVIETRVRVDMYSNVRAIVETNDGRLLMATKFVKAAGGCSAPALKDTDAALVDAGRMQVRHLPTDPSSQSSGQQVGQVMIRHPQYSGMQMNQATGYYIPAKFLRVIDISRGGERVFRVEGGFSLSEDPNIRFTYASGSDDTIEVMAEDTDGRTFTGRSEPKGS